MSLLFKHPKLVAHIHPNIHKIVYHDRHISRRTITIENPLGDRIAELSIKLSLIREIRTVIPFVV